MVDADIQERRAALRSRVSASVEIEVGGRRLTARLHNISVTGAKLSATTRSRSASG